MKSGSMVTASLFLVAMAAAHAQVAPATAVVDGVVTDTNLVSLADAAVSILGSKLQVVTGANGRFRIRDLAAGQYILVVHRLGYVPVSTMLQIAERDTLRMSFTLKQIATALDTVVVAEKAYSSRMTEFEQRRRLGFGHFITQDEIDKKSAISIGDLLRPVLSVGIEDRKLFVEVAMNMRYGCPFSVFLDGTHLPPPVNLYDLPVPKEIGGIEIYSGEATIPLQYKTMGDRAMANATCGVILVWTRDGS